MATERKLTEQEVQIARYRLLEQEVTDPLAAGLLHIIITELEADVDKGWKPVKENVRTDEESSAFLGDIVDDVEDAEASSIGELIVDEVEGPACVRLRFHQDRRPGACRLAAGPTLADSEPFLPIEPVDPVDPGRLALPPQQDEQPAIAEPAAFIGQLAQPARSSMSGGRREQ